jgi:hypothetical protein
VKVNHRGIKPAESARPAPRSYGKPPTAEAAGFPWNAIAAQLKAKTASVLGAWLVEETETEATLVVRIRGPRLSLSAFANMLTRGKR